MSARVLLVLAVAAALHAQGGVEGKVVATTNGAAVRKATVLLRAARIAGADDSHPRDSYLTLTDSNGHFSITGMVAGTYDCVPSRTGFGGVPPDAIASTKYYPLVTVENGKTTSGILVKLTPLGVISGRVMDAEGDPVVRVQVMVMTNSYPNTGAQSRQTRGWAQTNDRGEYRVYNLFPGTYYVAANGNGNQGFGPVMNGQRLPILITTYHPATTEPEQAAPVELRPGAEAQATDIHMQRIRVFSIRGKAPPMDQNHNYMVNAQRRSPDFRGMFGGGGRMRNGEWEIPGLEPGSYVVTMTRVELNNGRGAIMPRGGSGEGQTTTYAFVEIADKDVDGVECTFPGAEVSGVVKSIGEKPAKLTDFRVMLAPEGGRTYQSEPVKADGGFSISGIMPDTYRITVQPGNSAYMASVKLESQELASRELDLRRGGGASLAITVANDFADAEGKVTDADGNPEPSVNVTFVPDQSKSDWRNSFNSQLTDSQGRFVFRRIIPGTYTIFAWKDAPRSAPQDANFRKPFEKQGVTVTLGPNGHQSLDLKSIVTEKP